MYPMEAPEEPGAIPLGTGGVAPKILERLAQQVSADELEAIARGNALEMLGLA